MNTSKIKKLGIVLLVVFFALTLTGCGNGNGIEIFTDFRMTEPEPHPEKPFLYEDDIITAQFRPILDHHYRGGTLEGVVVTLENKTDENIKIIWDDASYVNIEGYTTSLAHGEVSTRRIGEGETISPTNIPTKSKKELFLIPVDKVVYDDGWQIEPLFTIEVDWDVAEKLSDEIRDNGVKVGEREDYTFRYILPIEIDNKVLFYDFKFEGNLYMRQK